MFDHMGIDVRNLEKSKTFYNLALAPLGFKLVMDLPDYKSAGYGETRPMFWLGEGKPNAGDEAIHICFAAKSRAAVKAFYEAAILAGGRDNGKPGMRPEYHPNYYGAFVIDQDGYNIEACCHLPE